jgi:hypothetical protein
MPIRSSGTATFRTQSTNELLAVEGSHLDWDAVGGDERGMGAETTYEAQAELLSEEGRTYEVTWEVSEYPAGVLNHMTCSHPDLRRETDIVVAIVHGP